MKRIGYSALGLVLLIISFFAFSVANQFIFSGVKLDLTQQKLYTLSEGTRKILAETKEPIQLYFFFSDKATQDIAQLASWRSYAKNVEEMLKEYVQLSNGNIKLTVIDPEPFSAEEEKAAEFGLQKIPLQGGEEVYFGLVGSNSLDTQEIMPFLQQEQEEFLEYDISKMIQKLSHPSRPLVNMITGIAVAGDFDPRGGGAVPPWIITDTIKEIFDFRKITSGAPHIDPDADILLLVQPTELSEETLYEIDQFVMKGGKVIVFADPYAELSPAAESISILAPLLKNWGVQVRDKTVVTDLEYALSVNVPDSTQPVRHVALLGLTGQAIVHEQVVTAGLERVNVSTAGIVETVEGAKTRMTPIFLSSERSMPMSSNLFKNLRDPSALVGELKPTGERYAMAALINGPATSLFDQPREGTEFIKQTDNINVLVIADSDMLSDRLWVSVQQFFGQSVTQPWADNGSFVINAIDFFTGDDALISVRSRGRFSRPFDVVSELRAKADQRFYESEQHLEKQLAEAEKKLSELQNQKDLSGKLVLSPEQEAAIAEYQQQKTKISKELRAVKHELNRDIEILGVYVKWITIALVPLLLTLGALIFYGIRWYRRR